MIARLSPRFHVQVPVSFMGDREGRGTLSNVSINGGLIVSDTAVETGDYLSLTLHLPNGRPPITIERAEVRWSTEHDFGVGFISLQQPDQIQLFDYLNTIAAS